jgi:hypothetical protein
MVTVSKLLEAVMETYGEDMTIRQLYELTLAKSDDVKMLYRNFTVKVYVGDDPIVLPVDMCVHGNC